jgi:hypothetical protein
LPTSSASSPTTPAPTQPYGGMTEPFVGMSGPTYTPATPFGGNPPGFSAPTSSPRSRRRVY